MCSTCDGELEPRSEYIWHPSGLGLVPTWVHVNHTDWADDPHRATPKEVEL